MLPPTGLQASVGVRHGWFLNISSGPGTFVTKRFNTHATARRCLFHHGHQRFGLRLAMYKNISISIHLISVVVEYCVASGAKINFVLSSADSRGLGCDVWPETRLERFSSPFPEPSSTMSLFSSFLRGEGTRGAHGAARTRRCVGGRRTEKLEEGCGTRCSRVRCTGGVAGKSFSLGARAGRIHRVANPTMCAERSDAPRCTWAFVGSARLDVMAGRARHVVQGGGNQEHLRRGLVRGGRQCRLPVDLAAFSKDWVPGLGDMVYDGHTCAHAIEAIKMDIYIRDRATKNVMPDASDLASSQTEIVASPHISSPSAYKRYIIWVGGETSTAAPKVSNEPNMLKRTLTEYGTDDEDGPSSSKGANV
ncbi:hypothetical protein C8J57DRAFT_1240485 [Mycena rebaudengoi]|nr:hypothetical protein C8J57DRAFT_1240485 [Mycena rebaudengoi]